MLFHLIEDLAHDRHKAHVSHSICLVNDNNLYVVQPYRTLVHEVLKTSWTGDSNIDAAAKSVELRPEPDSTVKTGNPAVTERSKKRKFLTDLRC